MKILVTGGAGFIGSAVIRHIILSIDWRLESFNSVSVSEEDQVSSSFKDLKF